MVGLKQLGGLFPTRVDTTIRNILKLSDPCLGRDHSTNCVTTTALGSKTTLNPHKDNRKPIT